jgi:hypothetical protein
MTLSGLGEQTLPSQEVGVGGGETQTKPNQTYNSVSGTHPADGASWISVPVPVREGLDVFSFNPSLEHF